MRKSVMAGIVAAGAIGAALAVGGVAYAAGDETGGRGEQIVRVVEDDGSGAGYTGTGRDCPDKGGDQDGSGSTAGTGENL